MSEVFWLTREHVFLIGAPEVGRSQAARCLLKRFLLQRWRCIVSLRYCCLPPVLTMSSHQDSAKWAEAVSVMLYMSILCFWHLQSVFKYLVFKMQESREGKDLLSCWSAPRDVSQQDLQASRSYHISLEEPSRFWEDQRLIGNSSSRRKSLLPNEQINEKAMCQSGCQQHCYGHQLYEI